MSTILITPSNTLAKMRFQEPFVSEGLNKKLNGIIPNGIVRGGDLVTNTAALQVRIDADPNTGDSVYSYIDANGHQLTFRQVGAIVLDLAPVASTSVYIAAFIQYTTSTATVVQWRAYTLAELTTAPVAEAPEVIVVGRVDVPAGGPIVASEITPELRRDAWANIAKSTSPWVQVVENGHWDMAEETTISGSALSHVVSWSNTLLLGASYTWRIVTTAPLSGAHELEILGDGGSDEVQTFFGDRQVGVRPGELIRVRFSIRGSVWGGIGASGVQGVRLTFYDKNKQVLSTQDVTDSTLSGTFAYTLVDDIVEVPASAAFMCYAMRLDTDALTPSGSIFFDEIRVWKQSSQVLEEDTRQRLGFDTGVAGAAHLTPVATLGATIDDVINETRRVLNGGVTGGIANVVAAIMGETANGFDFNATKMGIKVQRQIKELGASLLGTEADALLARIAANYAPTATGEYTLMWEMPIDSGSAETIRLYASEAGLSGAGVGAAITVTVNASWNGSVWNRDVAAVASCRFDVSNDRASFRFRAGTETDGWGDNLVGWNQELEMILQPPILFGGGVDVVTDGRFRYSGGSSIYNNPSSTKTLAGAIVFDSIASNVLYANSVSKCWASIRSDGSGSGTGGVAIDDGMNIDSVSITAGGDLSVSFAITMGNADYVVLVTGQDGNLITGVSFNETTSGFDLDIRTIVNASDVNLTISIANFCFAVFGRN